MTKQNLPYFLIGISAFFYVFLRSIYVDVTYDEAWTIRDFVSLGSMDIVSFTPCDANNHMTNTLLIKAFQNVLGDSLFVARLPNLLAFVLFLYFSFKICSKFLQKHFGILLFIALIANPFLLEFFGLARGYGLAIGFMIASVYYLLDFLQSYRIRTAVFSMIFASLAVLSNFPLINYWLAVFFIIHMAFWLSKKPHFFKLLGFNSLNILVLTALIYEPIRKLLIKGSFYFGGEDDFYTDTLTSLTSSSMNVIDDNSVTLILNVFLVLIAVIAFSSFYRNFRLAAFFSEPRKTISLLLFLVISSTIAQHYLLDSLYLIDRVALFFYPLIVLFIFFLANGSSNIYFGKVNETAAGFIVFACMFNLFQNSNLYKATTWEFDSHSEEVVDFLNEIDIPADEQRVLGSTWLLQKSITYYRMKNPNSKIKYLGDVRFVKQTKANYFLFYGKPLKRHADFQKYNPIPGIIKDTLLAFPEEGIYLFELK